MNAVLQTNDRFLVSFTAESDRYRRLGTSLQRVHIEDPEFQTRLGVSQVLAGLFRHP